MFLTPFVDFGEPIEKFIGQANVKEEDERPLDVEIGNITAKKESPHIAAAQPTRARIIGASDKLRITASTEQQTTLEGTGIAIGSGPLDQSKAYFEILVESDSATFSVGALGRLPNTVLAENWQVLGKVPNSICAPLGTFTKGETIGVLVDISDFPPSVSGFRDDDQLVKKASASARGDLWPALELKRGSVSVIFNRDELHYLTAQRMSRGIEAVMLSRSII